MEKDDGLRFNWQPLVQMNNNNNNSSSNSGSGSGGVDQLATAATFLNLNWDQSYTEQAANFESALSSLVSSPTSSSAVAPCSDTCCYTTPLNSPPKQQQQQQFMPFAADPGFVERAARFSCFGAGEVGKLSRVSSSKSLKSNVKESSNYDYVGGGKEIVNPMQTEEGGPEIGGAGGGQLDIMSMMMMMTMMRSGGSNAPEDSAGSGRELMASSGGEGNVRKRKAKAKNTPKMANEENSNAKRCKSSEGDGADTGKLQKVEQNGESSAQKQSKDKDEKKEKDNDVKPTEPPKQDYIHVRARRGQATDSHSLAERVRREKIGERMKFLQDLVPGCNKVTGKAVMLDEIINYVQSLQRQVEFLSMKLATVNPRLDFNADGLLSKDTQQPASGLVSSSHLSFPLDQASSAAFSYSKQPQGLGQGPPHPTLQSFLTNGGMETQCSVNPLDNGLRRSLNMHLPPLDSSFMDAASQLGPFWEDDLLSVVQMGFGQQNQLEIISSSHNLQGTLPTNHMKIEL